MKSIALLLGATPETLEYVNEYLRIIILGAPAIILSFSLGQLVRAEGSAKVAMAGMIMGTVINIVLDPIFILTLEKGVAGAAIATVLANIITVIYYIIYFFNKKIRPKRSIRYFKPDKKYV